MIPTSLLQKRKCDPYRDVDHAALWLPQVTIHAVQLSRGDLNREEA